MQKTQNKKPKQHFVDENPIEAMRSIPSRVTGSFVDDLLKPASTNDLWEQLLGVEPKKAPKGSGDLAEGEPLDLKMMEEQTAQVEKKTQEAAPGIDYFREVVRGDKTIIDENGAVLEQRISQIMIELKQLSKSSSELHVAFKQVTVEKAPVNPGKYHLGFFEWVLSVIKSARLRVDESKSWLSLFASKKKQRSYWSMFKKHGTSFGLSNERVVSTQTG